MAMQSLISIGTCRLCADLSVVTDYGHRVTEADTAVS